MDESKPGHVELKVTYENDPGYRECWVNGAYGGVSPRGEIMAWLYFERQGGPLSFETTAELIDGDRLRAKDPGRPNQEIVRRVQVAVNMSPETAVSIGKWLLKHAEAILGGTSDASSVAGQTAPESGE